MTPARRPVDRIARRGAAVTSQDSGVETHAMNAATEHRAIELKVDEARQLFESLDPFPFRERDLDKNAEDYIVGWARELPRDASIKIVVHLPEAQIHDKLTAELGEAVSHFFAYRAVNVGLELKELFRIGRFSLAVGASVLALSILAAQQVPNFVASPSLERVIAESLIILGWVANWRPLEIFLYDWWPIMRRRNLYRRLAKARLEIQPAKKGQ